MLGRKDLGPLLEIITSAENVDIRLAGLDAVTRFQLTADAWRAVGPALRRVLGETAQGLPERATAIELAAWAPLTSVRSQLTALSDATDDPDAASARRVLHRPSSSDVEALLQRLENSRSMSARPRLPLCPSNQSVTTLPRSARWKNGFVRWLRTGRKMSGCGLC